jgi:cytochrome c oxidase subunit IV
MIEHEHSPHVSYADDPNIPTDTEHRHHPRYLLVFLALLLLTVFEVGVTYIQGIVHAPFILGMSFLKILLVLAYFMHLRFDSKWFSFIFFIPFVLVIPFIIVTLLN